MRVACLQVRLWVETYRTTVDFVCAIFAQRTTCTVSASRSRIRKFALWAVSQASCFKGSRLVRGILQRIERVPENTGCRGRTTLYWTTETYIHAAQECGTRDGDGCSRWVQG